ncbi:MAG: hypothetical protein ACRD0P_12205 [Stackebrandtia sp.]
MSTMVNMSPRFRLRVAVLLLVATGVIIAVVVSQLFIGTGDPRDTIASRAAGFGFTDLAHETLYGAVPLALPLIATLLAGGSRVRLVAAVEYGVLIVLGVVLSGAALFFGLDAAQQQQYGAETVYIDTRSAVEALFADVTMLVLAAVAMVVCLRTRVRRQGA